MLCAACSVPACCGLRAAVLRCCKMAVLWCCGLRAAVLRCCKMAVLRSACCGAAVLHYGGAAVRRLTRCGMVCAGGVQKQIWHCAQRHENFSNSEHPLQIMHRFTRKIIHHVQCGSPAATNGHVCKSQCTAARDMSGINLALCGINPARVLVC